MSLIKQILLLLLLLLYWGKGHANPVICRIHLQEAGQPLASYTASVTVPSTLAKPPLAAASTKLLDQYWRGEDVEASNSGKREPSALTPPCPLPAPAPPLPHPQPSNTIS
jgi:hypothetical protein